jgi:hypothetical protein
MQFIAILASLVSVAAFAPASRMAPSAALKMGFEDALGAQAPLGFWDPLGASSYNYFDECFISAQMSILAH